MGYTIFMNIPAAKKPASPREDGSAGGRSCSDEPLSSKRWGEKMGKGKESFFGGGAGSRHGGGAASLGVLLKVGSSKVQNFPHFRKRQGVGSRLASLGY